MKKSRADKEEDMISDFVKELDLSDDRVRKRVVIESTRQAVFKTPEGQSFLKKLADTTVTSDKLDLGSTRRIRFKRRILCAGSVVLIVLGGTGITIGLSMSQNGKAEEKIADSIKTSIYVEEVPEKQSNKKEPVKEKNIYDGRFQSKSYVIADSDTEFITERELEDLTYEQMSLALKEIYARHGRTFYDVNIQAYFDAKTWYHPLPEGENYSDRLLNDIERTNIRVLKECLDLMEENSSAIFDYSSLTIEDMMQYISSVNLLDEEHGTITESSVRAIFYDFLESGYITKGKWNLQQMGAL